MANVIRKYLFFELVSPQEHGNRLFYQSVGNFESFDLDLFPAQANSLPYVDIFEDKDNITLQAEVPGMKREDLNIAVENNRLTVSGERTVEDDDDEYYARNIEPHNVKFTRYFTLPDGVNCQNMYAIFANGILNITLPKRNSIH